MHAGAGGELSVQSHRLRWWALDFYKEIVRFAKSTEIWVLSDLWPMPDIYFGDTPPPSILKWTELRISIEISRFRKTFSALAGCLAAGNEKLIGALARIKTVWIMAPSRPFQVAAAAALNGPTSMVDEIRAVYKSRRDVLVRSMGQAGWMIPSPEASMFAWAPVPDEVPRGRPRWSSPNRCCFCMPRWRSRRGSAFGEYGEGYARVALVENEHRIRRAARNVEEVPLAWAPMARRPIFHQRRIWRTQNDFPMTKGVLKIAIAGLGTVGGGVVKTLASRQDALAAQAGRKLEIVAVSARDSKKKRDFPVGSLLNDPLALASSDADVVVELIGGEEGIARKLVETALQNGKHVVTANKALLARHGKRLAEMAEANNLQLKFEAAVAGGIPIVTTLREALIAHGVDAVKGILNGDPHLHPHRNGSVRRSFDEVVEADAQTKRCAAEADPTLDIGGGDTAHKLASAFQPWRSVPRPTCSI